MSVSSRSLTLTMMALLLSTLPSLAQVIPPVDLKPGDKAPNFKLLASDGKEYELAQFIGSKAIALCWFPRAGS